MQDGMAMVLQKLRLRLRRWEKDGFQVTGHEVLGIRL